MNKMTLLNVEPKNLLLLDLLLNIDFKDMNPLFYFIPVLM